MNEQQESTGAFPVVTCRRGTQLHFVFPIVGSLKCTEVGCNSVFVGKHWGSEKQSLKRHLETMHGLPRCEDFRWCMFCERQIKRRITTHPCLADFTLFDPSGETFAFKCRNCYFSCPTAGGIMNHARVHKREAITDRRMNSQGTSNAVNSVNDPPDPMINQISDSAGPADLGSNTP